MLVFLNQANECSNKESKKFFFFKGLHQKSDQLKKTVLSPGFIQDTQSEWHFKFVCKIHMAYLKSLPGKFLFCLEEQMCLKFIFCIFTSWGEFKRHHIPLLIFKTTPEVNTENKVFLLSKEIKFFSYNEHHFSMHSQHIAAFLVVLANKIMVILSITCFSIENNCDFRQNPQYVKILLYWKRAYFTSLKMGYILLVPFELI